MNLRTRQREGRPTVVSRGHGERKFQRAVAPPAAPRLDHVFPAPKTFLFQGDRKRGGGSRRAPPVSSSLSPLSPPHAHPSLSSLLLLSPPSLPAPPIYANSSRGLCIFLNSKRVSKPCPLGTVPRSRSLGAGPGPSKSPPCGPGSCPGQGTGVSHSCGGASFSDSPTPQGGPLAEQQGCRQEEAFTVM